MTRNAPRIRIALPVSLAALILAIVPATALAGGHHGGSGSTSGSSSITGPIMVVDNNGNGLPNWGDTVTFSVSTTATTTPEVGLACYQNGTEVYYHYGGFYAGDPWAPADQMYTLKSMAWTGGAADCTATLFYMNSKGHEVDLTSISFHVDA